LLIYDKSGVNIYLTIPPREGIKIIGSFFKMRCSIKPENLYSSFGSQLLPIIQSIKNQIINSRAFWPKIPFFSVIGLGLEINYLVNADLLLSPLDGGQPINLSKIKPVIYEYHQKQNRVFIKQIT
jgi:hypothetical protein